MTRFPSWTLLVCSLFGLSAACAPGSETTMTGADGGSSGGSDDDDTPQDDDEEESDTGSDDEEDPEGSATSSSGGNSASNSGGSSGSSSNATSGGSESSNGTSTSGSSNTSSSSTSLSGGDTTNVDCAFEIMASISPNIGTVGIVEWSVDLGNLEQAEIEFGLDTNYGMTAPVDLADPGYRTLLLGMKPNKEYHFRIVASGGGERCESEDQVITTQGPPNGTLPRLTIDTMNADARGGGFKVFSFWTNRWAVILDADGEYVWWYQPSGGGGGGLGGMNDMSRARMSFDGKSMWMRNTNVGNTGSSVTRVAMDGSGEQTYDTNTVNGHHDFTVTPDNGVTFIAFEESGPQCDDIVEMDESGNVTTVYHLRDAVGSLIGGGGAGQCHSNAIHYNAFDDSYTVSQRDFNTIVKVSRAGELVWILGGGIGNFQGDVTWSVQHGHHNIAEDRIVFFNNGAQFMGGTSAAVELQLTGTSQATRVWEYQVNGLSSATLGDVQRLPNGNTLVVYSNAGEIHEVDEQRNVIETISAGLGGVIAYIEARPTLYGPPPR